MQRRTKHAQSNLIGRYINAKLNGIDFSNDWIVLDDQVTAIAEAELIGIVTDPALQGVVTSATDKDIIACAAVEDIVTIAAGKRVIAAATKQRIVSGVAGEGIVTTLAKRDVIAVQPGNRIASVCAVQPILLITALNHQPHWPRKASLHRYGFRIPNRTVTEL